MKHPAHYVPVEWMNVEQLKAQIEKTMASLKRNVEKANSLPSGFLKQRALREVKLRRTTLVLAETRLALLKMEV